jgi:hypothetical protein
MTHKSKAVKYAPHLKCRQMLKETDKIAHRIIQNKNAIEINPRQEKNIININPQHRNSAQDNYKRHTKKHTAESTKTYA